jgi:hypothetical protein
MLHQCQTLCMVYHYRQYARRQNDLNLSSPS